MCAAVCGACYPTPPLLILALLTVVTIAYIQVNRFIYIMHFSVPKHPDSSFSKYITVRWLHDEPLMPKPLNNIFMGGCNDDIAEYLYHVIAYTIRLHNAFVLMNLFGVQKFMLNYRDYTHSLILDAFSKIGELSAPRVEKPLTSHSSLSLTPNRLRLRVCCVIPPSKSRLWADGLWSTFNMQEV